MTNSVTRNVCCSRIMAKKEEGISDCQKVVNEIKKYLPEILENPVVKEFLKDKKNKKDFFELMDGVKDNCVHLDNKFRDFYLFNRTIGYMSGLIRRYPIDYDKRVKKRNKRFQLIFDKPINNGSDDSNVTMGDFIAASTKTPEEYLIKNENKNEILFQVKNPILYESLKILSQKQLEILNLYYMKGYTNRNIAEYFGQTEQNISYWHKKTLNQLKEILIEKSEEMNKK
ncbi:MULTISPECIES: sigma-70 family RNA polymerase sigma factor [unclassified Oceanobacillus]|uniref:sigma-70 family RNA polymerase sigma factor n=1 Tax=unclassified Oceanobacillus TaxID=2630292 RepID=UPI00300E084A